MSSFDYLISDPVEEASFWASFGYTSEETIYCPLCNGQHGNNTQCQRND